MKLWIFDREFRAYIGEGLLNLIVVLAIIIGSSLALLWIVTHLGRALGLVR